MDGPDFMKANEILDKHGLTNDERKVARIVMYEFGDYLRRLRANSPVAGPKCPKCGSEFVAFGVRFGADDIHAGRCSKLGCGYEGPSGEFFPAAPRPQPEGLEQIAREIAEIRQRAEKATQGEWMFEKSPRPHEGTVHYWIRTVEKLPQHPHSERFIAFMTGGLGDAHPSRKPSDYRDDPETEADAGFIAHARTDIPRLLEIIAQFQAHTLPSGTLPDAETLAKKMYLIDFSLQSWNENEENRRLWIEYARLALSALQQSAPRSSGWVRVEAVPEELLGRFADDLWQLGHKELSSRIYEVRKDYQMLQRMRAGAPPLKD